MARFFYTPKPRKFDYKPRYYDPEAEARAERLKELRGERPSDSTGEYVPGELLRSRYAAGRRAAQEMRARNRRRSGRTMLLVVLLGLLAAAVMWVLR